MDNETAVINEISDMTDQVNTTHFGSRFIKAREAMHLTQKEAAARLYLNPKIIEIIENDNFVEGPPITFMRGYLKSYAKLLNIPDQEVREVIQQLEVVLAPPVATVPVTQPTPSYRGDRYLKWFTYFIVVVLISLVVLWWNSHAKYSENDTQTPTGQTITAPVVENTAAPAAAPPPSTTIVGTTVITTPEQSSDATTHQAPAPVVETVNLPAATTVEVPPVAQPAEVAPMPAPVNTTPSAVEPATESPMAIQDADSLNAATMGPTATDTDNAVVTEKPVKKVKKKVRRRQYRPIEEMEIPEPE